MILERNNRLLIVDDNQSIHDDFRKVLGAGATEEAITAAEELLFGATEPATPDFALTAASQGEEAVELTREAVAAGLPFAVAFLDIRMPPGIDGIETARRLWAIDPELQVVICSAYTDYSWTDMMAQLGAPERWVLLKKPFENIEVLQLAASLVEKRSLQQLATARRADLEASVAERTEKLQSTLAQLEQEAAERLRAEEERSALERKFEQAQRLESLGVLAGGLAHDFNNILTGILGRASLAREHVAPQSEIERHLHAIELCSRRAADLCEQMLAYAGRGRVVVREFDVNQLVEEMGGLVGATVPRDAEFRIELDPAAPIVRGDPARLRQVVMNLLINGAEALGPEPRRLHLATHVRRLGAPEIAQLAFGGNAEPGRFVIIQVSDTGSGMSPDTVQRIFEPFFSTKFEGRGLGLCAVHGIVRSHGGALDVASAPGCGSTFRVYLPLADAAPARVAPPAPPPREKAAGRLLVVDDEECVRVVVASALSRCGYNIVTADDGMQGLEIFRQDPAAIDGVVLDLTMPRMGGLAAIAAMRQLRPRLPAVLISGHNQEQRSDGFADADVTLTLQKPFEVGQLCASVAAMLHAGGLPAASPDTSRAKLPVRAGTP